MTVEVSGSYFIAAPPCISSREMRLSKRLLISPWLKETQSAVKPSQRKKEFQNSAKYMGAFPLQSKAVTV